MYLLTYLCFLSHNSFINFCSFLSLITFLLCYMALVYSKTSKKVSLIKISMYLLQGYVTMSGITFYVYDTYLCIIYDLMIVI